MSCRVSDSIVTLCVLVRFLKISHLFRMAKAPIVSRELLQVCLC